MCSCGRDHDVHKEAQEKLNEITTKANEIVQILRASNFKPSRISCAALITVAVAALRDNDEAKDIAHTMVDIAWDGTEALEELLKH